MKTVTAHHENRDEMGAVDGPRRHAFRDILNLPPAHAFTSVLAYSLAATPNTDSRTPHERLHHQSM